MLNILYSFDLKKSEELGEHIKYLEEKEHSAFKYENEIVLT